MADHPEHKIEYVSDARVTTLPDGGDYLLVTILIKCPVCGEIEMQIPGHHLRVIRNIAVEFVDMYPHLTNKDDELKVLRRLLPAAPEETKH